MCCEPAARSMAKTWCPYRVATGSTNEVLFRRNSNFALLFPLQKYKVWLERVCVFFCEARKVSPKNYIMFHWHVQSPCLIAVIAVLWSVSDLFFFLNKTHALEFKFRWLHVKCAKVVVKRVHQIIGSIWYDKEGWDLKKKKTFERKIVQSN